MFTCFWPTEKLPEMVANGAMSFFTTNLNLANILATRLFILRTFIFKDFLVHRFPDQTWAGLGPSLGWARPGLGPFLR